MKRPRPKWKHARRPLKPALGPHGLDRSSGPIVLLGLIASEAAPRCLEHEEEIRAQLVTKIDGLDEYWPEDADRWRERLRLWEPVRCTVEYVATSRGALIAAPTLTVGTHDRFARFSVCARGLLRIEPERWPEGFPVPTLSREPAHIAEALEWSKLVVERTIRPLFIATDPQMV